MNIILDRQFSDLDLLRSCTRAWDLDFRLTQKGGFSGWMRQVVSPELLITYAHLAGHLNQAGSTPPGFRTFGLPAAGSDTFWWLGYEVDDRSMTRFGTDSELAAVTGLGFAVYTISVREDYLDKLAEALGTSNVSKERGVVRLSKAQIDELRVLAGVATFHSSEPSRAAAANDLAVKLVASDTSGETLLRPSSRSRDGAVKRVLEFLDANPDALPDLPTLCRVSHVSERTLQYAFRERYATSPNAFVKCWQLNTARRKLCSPGDGDTNIADIAAQCGFFDPSLFASHYLRLFGELPSATAAKAASRTFHPHRGRKLTLELRHHT